MQFSSSFSLPHLLFGYLPTALLIALCVSLSIFLIRPFHVNLRKKNPPPLRVVQVGDDLRLRDGSGEQLVSYHLLRFRGIDINVFDGRELGQFIG